MSNKFKQLKKDFMYSLQVVNSKRLEKNISRKSRNGMINKQQIYKKNIKSRNYTQQNSKLNILKNKY